MSETIQALPLPWQSPHAAFAPVAHEPYALLLDSQTADSRWAFVAVRPRCVFSAPPINNQSAIVAKVTQINNFLKDFSHIEHTRKNFASPPFQGGLAGYISFEAGLAVNLIPLPQTLGQPSSFSKNPLFYLGFYDVVAAFDTHTHTALLTFLPGTPSDKVQALAALFSDIKTTPPSPALPSLPLQPEHTKDAFCQKVAAVRAYIQAGDLYQTNISQRFSAPLPPGLRPYDLFLRLRTANPAPYAAYFHTPANTLISCSPEQFLQCNNGLLRTRPIKGTAPRYEDTIADKASARALQTSEKDLAENRMIVDLLRHDIAQSCQAGSVRVPQFAALESFTAVHHLVSTIEGALQQNISPFSAFWAAFPGGSISGAPKRRAIEILRDIEGRPRGPYCGSLGYWGVGGTMDSSILIRTLVVERDTIRLDTGCGITWASDAAAEYQESLDKARAIREALRHSAHEIDELHR